MRKKINFVKIEKNVKDNINKVNPLTSPIENAIIINF